MRVCTLHVTPGSYEVHYDGVMIETHNNPEKALSDSKQQIKPVEFNSFFINE